MRQFGLSPRAAFARPRVLLSLMTLLLAGGSWWAMAQNQGASAPPNKPIKAAKSSKGGADNRKPLSWSDLPRLVSAYGQRRERESLYGKRALSAKSGGGASTRRFALTENDLTPGNISDEREPALRPPTADFIAFASNGVDADRNGVLDANAFSPGRRYHIWIIRRNATLDRSSGLRQVTGLGADANRDQRQPTWSPDGTRICYVDSGFANGTSQLSIIANPVSGASNPLPIQITFFPGIKTDPAWSPGADAIAFASNVAPSGVGNSGTQAGGFDIFTINPNGSSLSVRRLTGDPDNRASGAATPNDPQDVLGNTTDERHPSYSQENPGVMFFSTNRETSRVISGTNITISTSRLAQGRRIFAMNAFTGEFKRQITNPVARGGSAADEDDNPSASRAGQLPRGFPETAVSFGERVAFQTNSRIDTRDTVRDLNVWSLSVNTSDADVFLNSADATRLPFEGSASASGNVAQVESNVLSTPAATSLFEQATEDRAADREPAFSRASGRISSSFASLVFASARRVSPRPGSNGQNPRPVVVNPGGGDAATATHDLWTTTSQDFTPPLLVPVGTGNQATPFLAPGRQAPFYAPRTAEEGLTSSSKLIVAVVLSEQESGLNTASVVATATPNPNPTAEATEGPIVSPPDEPFTGVAATVRIRSSEPTFTNVVTRPNEGVAISASVEQSPAYITDEIRLDVYDNGPPSQGGNERQANAIRGDGIYYAQASIDLADALEGQGVGDFMIDLSVTDRANNSLLYDKVFGFSTEAFRKRANMLFVSDYTSGQNFPSFLLGADAGGRTDARGNSIIYGPLAHERGLPPVESYHLANPGGLAQDLPISSFNGPADLTTFSPPGTASFGVVPTSVDVWRTLSRGPVTQGIYRFYQPQPAVQIDPNAPGRELRAAVNPVPTTAPTAGPTSRPTPGSTPNRTPEPLPTVPVTVAENAIVWAAPYSGIVLAAPGTIADVETQGLLTDYLRNGGRLFLNGQDIIFALTGAGTIDNAFVREELRTSWSRETGAADQLTPNYGYTINGNGNNRISNRGNDAPLRLRVPFQITPALDNTYFDAADNDTFGDILGTVADGANTSVTEVYAYGNDQGRAGHLVDRSNRTAGLQSRLVFFGFGLEHINREWTTGNLGPARNYRSKIAENIANEIRTGRISGRVIDTAGNPIPNFLMQITDPGFDTRFFMVRTDANGFYEFVGVPSRDGFYRVSPASQIQRNGRVTSLNAGFFTNQNIFTSVTVLGGQETDDINFRINPAPPSSVIGRAISDRGTPSNIGDDDDPNVDVAPNVPVLLRSLDSLPPSEQAPTGGFYAQLTQTDASGQFSFNNVPGDVRVEIIFNPLPGFTTNGGDIPVGSGINYNTPTSLIQRNPNFGRRVIPDDRTYNGPRISTVPETGDLVVPTGMTIDLGDVPIPPAGSDISGRVFRVVNGQRVGASGATVQLLSGGGVVRTVTTNTQGLYTLGDIQPGSYTVVATLIVGQSVLRGSVAVSVARATNAIAPDILLGTSTPGGTPTPTPTGGPGGRPTPTPTTAPQDETYQPGQTYLISVPFADSSAATATTTVARAFTALPRVGTVVNYRLTRYDAARGVYVELTGASLIRRGEGYFLTPLARGVSLRVPPADRTRIPLAGTQFTITLRRVASAGQNLPNGTSNGYNLIGFPFNPAGFSSINWLESRVISPIDGRTMTLPQAVGAGLIDANLLTLQDGTRNYVRTQTMVPFRGYFARAFRDNVRVILFARR